MAVSRKYNDPNPSYASQFRDHSCLLNDNKTPPIFLSRPLGLYKGLRHIRSFNNFDSVNINIKKELSAHIEHSSVNKTILATSPPNLTSLLRLVSDVLKHSVGPSDASTP